MNISLGKAGRKRWMGRKPHNRGTSMNPVSHPMGGGEGRTAGGRHPCSPTGVLAKGGKTRKKRKPSNSAIIRRRRPGPHYAGEITRVSARRWGRALMGRRDRNSPRSPPAGANPGKRFLELTAS